jgi:hypothetical protein
MSFFFFAGGRGKGGTGKERGIVFGIKPRAFHMLGK